MSATTHTRALNDSSNGLNQQMIFWGHDVKHSKGNCLVAYGMTRRKTDQNRSSSCYSIPWEEGLIELHGTLAAWVPPIGVNGCVFSRNLSRILVWNLQSPPVPGQANGTYASAETRWNSFLPFLRWIHDYEYWIHQQYGPEWRISCWQAVKNLPRAKPWLSPDLARDWWSLAIYSLPPKARSLSHH